MSTPRRKAARRVATPPTIFDAEFTDIGNAERFVNFFIDHMAFVPEVGTWRRWTGKRWIDDNDEALRNAQIVAKSWVDDLVQESDPVRQRALLRHAQRSSSVERLQAMITIARTRGLTIRAREWDADPMLFGTPSGAIDLRTGSMIAPDQRRHISKSAPVDLDPEARAALWAAFLDRIFDGDVAMIAFLQRAIGYSLTGSTSEECLFLCHGSGANGKSKLIGALRALFGDYGRDCAAETLLARRDAGIPNDVARLSGARFVSAVETDDGKRLAEAMVKAMTGGDRLVARFLHREFFEFQPEFKVWLATNHKPTIRGTDNAIWRRIRLVPFAVTIPEGERDKELLARLTSELPGVLAWSVQGCLAWQRDGLQSPEPVKAATNAYRADMDRLGQWIEERCVVAPHCSVKASMAFKNYREWSDERNEAPLNMTQFGFAISDKGFAKVKGATVTYHGFGIRDSSADPMTVFDPFPVNSFDARARGEKGETCQEGVKNEGVTIDFDGYRKASRGD